MATHKLRQCSNVELLLSGKVYPTSWHLSEAGEKFFTGRLSDEECGRDILLK